MTSHQGTAFVVEGMTGEYSDRTEWPVRAYLDRAEAEAFLAYCESWERSHGMEWGRVGQMQRPAHDPHYGRDCSTGTSYYIVQVPLWG